MPVAMATHRAALVAVARVRWVKMQQFLMVEMVDLGLLLEHLVEHILVAAVGMEVLRAALAGLAAAGKG